MTSLLETWGPPATLLDDLKARYAEPQRYYHTWDHIEALLIHLEHFKLSVSALRPMVAAILWHDAIYDPKRKDNEQLSAELLAFQASTWLSANDLMRAKMMVLATEGHQIPPHLNMVDTFDLAFFLDFDLSVLGAEQPIYDTYDEAIRKEYSHVPDDQYRAGRLAVLEDFLGREKIYFTSLCQEAWQDRARENLQRSIDKLRAAS